MSLCANKPSRLIRLAFSLVMMALCALFLFGCSASEEELQPDVNGCLGKHHTAQVNGTSLYYEVAGTGKPVIVLHGNGGSHHDLTLVTNQLVKEGYQVYAIDSRGQGANEPLDEYHYADMAEDVYQFIELQGLERPAVYGWSDGGIIALMEALDHPESVSCIAISGANIYPEGLNPRTLSGFSAMASTSKNPLLTMAIGEPRIDPEELTLLDIPVLVTAGENDIILPEHIELIAQSLPNAQLVTFAGEDHGSYIAGNTKMAHELVRFLGDCDY